MEKKTIIVLWITLALFLLSACAASDISATPTQIGVGDIDTDTDIVDISLEQASAYYAVFENLYEIDPGLNSDCEYIAFDLTNVKLEDTSLLINLFQEFCDNNNYSMLLDDFEGLNQKGFIMDLSFPNGILIAFDDTELTNDTLVTDARKWRSGRGAIGCEYTVKLNNSTWEITGTANHWIS